MCSGASKDAVKVFWSSHLPSAWMGGKTLNGNSPTGRTWPVCSCDTIASANVTLNVTLSGTLSSNPEGENEVISLELAEAVPPTEISDKVTASKIETRNNVFLFIKTTFLNFVVIPAKDYPAL